MRNLTKELKQRNVFRVAAAYLIIAWVFAQVAELVLDSFSVDPWVMQVILIVLGAGLPVAIFLAWAFEITPEGIKKEEEIDRATELVTSSGRTLNFIVIALLAVTVVYFVVDKVRQPPAVQPNLEASIAVLPFTNRSAEPDTEYFADGMHDELLTQLARIAALKVISRTSVMEYRDTTKNMRQIGKELGVNTLLEGAVQRAGDRVRVIAQLIDANTDNHLWAETFDSELTPANLFEIQTEIAEAIALQLSITLTAEGGNAMDSTPTDNQQAYDLYLRARAIPFDGAVENLWKGIKLLELAIELDPQFALAMGQIATNYLNIYWFTTQQPEHRDAAQDWINSALAIAPEDPRLQLTLAELLYTGFLDYDAALAALDKAQKGMPGVSAVYLNRGAILRRRGDIGPAIEAFNKAQLLNPRDAFSFAHHVFTYIYFGDIERAQKQGETVRAMPSATSVHLGFSYLPDLFMLGDTESIAAFLASEPDLDLGPEDQLKIFVPFLEKRYDDTLDTLNSLPDPIAEQNNLWTHSWVRARVAHARGNLEEARTQATLAVTELDEIAGTMAGNARPVVARAMMNAILGDQAEARANIQLATQLHPVEEDMLDGPLYIADGLRALAVFADSGELAQAMESYLALRLKPYYIDFLLLDPVFDRHREDPAIVALQQQYTLRSAE